MNPSSNLHSDLPVVDRSCLDELRDMGEPGDVSMLITLLEMFFRLAPPLHQQLLDALERGDCAAVNKLAHKLSGSCGNFGGMRVTRICMDMENTQGDLAALHSMLPSLEEAFTELCGQLQRELDTLKPS